jgi:putative CocE/NonD family hydrolase
VLVETDLAVPMRDGVVLRADVYRPDGADAVPAIVSRTPYDRSLSLTPPAAVDPERAVEAGFALVVQDVRGQYSSDGSFDPFKTEPADGYDTIEWVAAQPWCSGEVGMAGRSYTAATQWLAAAEGPPHLRAICPVVTGSDFYDGWVYQGGAFQLGFNLFWVQMMTAGKKRGSLDGEYRHLPLTDPPLLQSGDAGRFYKEWLAHPTDDDHWRALSINRTYGRVEAPALNVGGWYDLLLGGTLENYARMRGEGGSEAARSGTRLLVGPWSHGNTFGSWPEQLSDIFGPDQGVDLDAEQLRFLDAHLNGKADDGPPVRIFVMGENRWRDEDEWPLSRALEERWHLREGGVLSPEPPGEEEHDVYDYDPADPAPTIGGPTSLPGRFLKTNSGPMDQRKVEDRDDVLVYTSAPLERELEVTGPLTVVLHAATSARDADWVAKLCDVTPEGESRILAEGVRRARFREGYEHPVAVEPGAIHAYEIDLVATSNVFLPGHRIRLDVTSSSFPRFDRNLGTGNPPGADGPEALQTARQTVFHSSERPSHVVLPVVPR